MQNQFNYCYIRIDTKQNLKNENTARSELNSLLNGITSMTFVRKGPRRKEFSTVLILLKGQDQADSLLKNPDFKLCGSGTKLCQIPEEEANRIEKESRTKLYVGNLPKSANNLDLWNHFKQFGKLAYSYVITNPKTKKSKGFGFVIFDKRNSMDKALAKKGQRIKGKVISMKPFLNKSQIRRQKAAALRKDTREEQNSARDQTQNQSKIIMTNSHQEPRHEKLKIPNMEFDRDSVLKAGSVVRVLHHADKSEGNLRYNWRGSNNIFKVQKLMKKKLKAGFWM